MTPKTPKPKPNPLKGIRSRLDNITKTIKRKHTQYADALATHEMKVINNTEQISSISQKLESYEGNMVYVDKIRKNLNERSPLTETQIHYIASRSATNGAGFALTWSVYATTVISMAVLGSLELVVFTGIVGVLIGICITAGLINGK